jgi:alpha-D-ribose 1-methylphosphonate 5-triphosphate synthase subunit PhnH
MSAPVALSGVTLPGFADPVGDAQATFRAMLDAMARPGRLHDVGRDLTVPAPLDRATAAVLLTLLDNETPVWLDPVAADARGWLAFHCGAAIVGAPGAAAFALALSLPKFSEFSCGTHEIPESSTTLILQVAALGIGTLYRLSGPGLRATADLAVTGLPDDFARIWQDNHALYPRGVDLVLCAGTALTALPRSVTIEEA